MMFPVIKILERKFISNPHENMWKGVSKSNVCLLNLLFESFTLCLYYDYCSFFIILISTLKIKKIIS